MRIRSIVRLECHKPNEKMGCRLVFIDFNGPLAGVPCLRELASIKCCEAFFEYFSESLVHLFGRFAVVGDERIDATAVGAIGECFHEE